MRGLKMVKLWRNYQRKKLEKKHASLLEDVRNFMDTTGQRVMENNLGLIRGNSV
jgi:hypothetical protein